MDHLTGWRDAERIAELRSDLITAARRGGHPTLRHLTQADLTFGLALLDAGRAAGYVWSRLVDWNRQSQMISNDA